MAVLSKHKNLWALFSSLNRNRYRHFKSTGILWMQRASVPQFGAWDGENIGFTTFFEKVRERKGVGPKIITPNDHEEKPNSYIPGRSNDEHKFSEKDHDYNSNYQYPAVKKYKKHNLQKDHDSYGYTEGSIPEKSSSQRSNIDSKRATNNWSNVLQPGNDRNDKASQHKNRQSYGIYAAESNYGIAKPKQQEVLHDKGRTKQNRQTHQKSTSVPRFGEWNETNFRSFERFTATFEKIKTDKEATAIKVQNVSKEPMLLPERRRSRKHQSFIDKIRDCLLPRVRE